MYTTVGRLSSYISQGVYTVSGPFHPFGGAVDIVVVEQQDGTFKCTPWYVKFGKFQGVLKRREKTVAIGVNDVPASFHMYLDHKGEAYFLEDLSDDDEKQPFSPPSGPSSGDEAAPALEYNKEGEGEAEGNEIENENEDENENDSGDEQEEVSELQFACEETSEDVSRAGSQERAQIYELLSEAVGEGSGPATSLFANSALVSIQKVAEGGGRGETTGEAKVEAAVETSVVREEQEEVASFTSKNGEYLINSYEVTQVVDKSFVIKGGDVQQLEENLNELDKQVPQGDEVNHVSSSEAARELVEEQVSGSEMILSATQEHVEAPGINLKASAEQEKAWTEVITKAAAALQEEPSQKKAPETGSVERRTWGWWVWRGSGASTVKKPEPKQQKPELKPELKPVLKPEPKIEELPPDEGSAQATTSESKKVAAQQQRSRSMLGMMFGGNREQQQKEINPENVVELLDNRWGGESKGVEEVIVETSDEQTGSPRVEEPQEQDEEEDEDAGAPVASDPRKERSITTNVDLSTAEVVLMSVDGHVVVAKQDESRASTSAAAGDELRRGAGDELEDDEQQKVVEEELRRNLTTAAPISVPGKRLLEMADSGAELKVGSESTLDTSPCRAEIGRLSNSLSSYFVDHHPLREGKSSATDASVSGTEFSTAADEADAGAEAEAEAEVEAMEKASMDVQVGSPWSTVSIPAASASNQDPEAAKAEQPEREASKNPGFELSLCRHLLNTGMGVDAAARVFDEHKLTLSSFTSSASLMGNEALVVRVGGKYYPSGVAASILFGLLAFGQVIPPKDGEPIKVEATETKALVVKPDSRPAATGGWRFWPFAFRRAAKPSEAGKVVSGDALLVATEAALHNTIATGLIRNGYYRRSWKLRERTLIPTSEQLASLNLRPGRNKITFSFTTRVLGQQQVDARIYLWKWNAKVVISDVDGTITKSDVLGQVMPLVGRDWTQTGVTRLFSAIKDNGYELMFLSARAISQAYLTRQFLINLKQDGEPLPDGPVVISPDGLFPSLYREVIRRAPHEFKIACLEDIKSLFPSECQPFYAGFGNRDTDEISYLKVGIPKGKIFIINPKGEVIVNNILDMKSYTSLHKLVNDMFPPVNLTEREDFNSWNYWKMPIPSIDD